MLSVAKCESGLIHIQSNGDVLRGRVTPADTGVMQINLIAHGKEVDRLGLDMENLYDNVIYARSLYEKNGLRDWYSSRKCWDSVAMK